MLSFRRRQIFIRIALSIVFMAKTMKIRELKDINMLLMRFLMRLHDKFVTIELKNGTVVAGYVSSVDLAMNFHLNRVTMTLKSQKPVSVEAVSVRGNNIRYIIFPKNLNLDALMIDNSQQKMRRYKTPSQSRGQDIGARGGRGRNLDSRRGGPSNRHFARGSGRGSAKSWNK